MTEVAILLLIAYCAIQLGAIRRTIRRSASQSYAFNLLSLWARTGIDAELSNEERLAKANEFARQLWGDDA